MTRETPTTTTSKGMLWTGRVISALPALMTGVMGPVMFFAAHDKFMEGLNKYGFPPNVGGPLVFVEFACAALYVIPQTAVLGAILLTGYFGGAVATHVHAGEPFWFPILIGVLVWLGLFLRDARIRAIVPFRR